MPSQSNCQSPIVIAGLDPAIHRAEASSVGGYVYILASDENGTLYVGITSDLVRRIYEHRKELADGFTKQYGVKRLVYFEYHDDIRGALQREKSLKKWPRAWKIDLIEKANPNWHDLYPNIANG